ncbi:MAG: ABC transporter ATP-binding protein [Deltaproteobacteria bacterium]|nr:ABC transporter ATP-binding protein [Deltaproteobacteria bacterium]
MFAFELAAATKHYARRRALAGVDLVVREHAAVGLLGPNGAGKTTALRLLLGFARPSRGAARLRGRDPYDPASRAGVGYLPERLALPGALTLRRFLRVHAALAGLSGTAAGRALEAAADTTGVRERLDERLGSLSKGLAQRAGFASALLGDPAVLVLDEPTSGLDPLGVRDARDWIQAARARGATVLVSSHVLSEVERTCDEVVILHEGRVAAGGPLGALVQPGESLEDAFVRAVRG